MRTLLVDLENIEKETDLVLAKQNVTHDGEPKVEIKNDWLSIIDSYHETSARLKRKVTLVHTNIITGVIPLFVFCSSYEYKIGAPFMDDYMYYFDECVEICNYITSMIPDENCKANMCRGDTGSNGQIINCPSAYIGNIIKYISSLPNTNSTRYGIFQDPKIVESLWFQSQFCAGGHVSLDDMRPGDTVEVWHCSRGKFVEYIREYVEHPFILCDGEVDL